MGKVEVTMELVWCTLENILKLQIRLAR